MCMLHVCLFLLLHVFYWFVPSLCCMQGNPKCAINFDRVFTRLKVENTPVDKYILQQKPNAFAKFSYCSPFFLNDEQNTRL